MTRLTSYQRDGLTFDVRDEGPEGGEPVVLLHGFPERSTCWREVVPRLHERGLRTYAPDQRGYSPGARPRRRRDYRVSELVGDVVALVEGIGRPVHLVGHDWGAAVGWTLVAQRPDLVRSWTAVSVPHPRAFARAMLTSRQGLQSWYMAAFQLPLLPELFGRTRGFEESLRRGGMTLAEVARFRTEIVEDGALPGALMWYRAIPLPDAAPSDHVVRVPTTFVWSDEDVAIARHGVDRTAALVEAHYRLVVLEGVSHWIPTQAPEALVGAILARTEGA